MQVFLADSATPDDQAALQSRLEGVPGVSAISYRSKAQAAARATRDPQLAPLAGASQGNPFPASFVLQMSDPGVAPRVLAAAVGDPAVDPRIPASYTAAQAQRLSSALGAMRFVAGALDVLALGVGAVVALALLRGEIRARRDELRILTLVGVPRAVIRVPLVVQVLSVAAAGSALAVLCLLYVDRQVVPAIDQSLPFLRLGSPEQAFGTLSLATVVASCVALLPCALLVRLPR
jgi:cell division protein FtsX